MGSILRSFFFSNFETCQKCENQAETAARTLFSMFGKVQNQAQNQIRNRETSKMTLFEVRELHEARRVTLRRQRGPERDPKLKLLLPCRTPLFAPDSKNAPRRPFKSFRYSPGPSKSQPGINFEPNSLFQAAMKPQSQVEPQNAT